MLALSVKKNPKQHNQNQNPKPTQNKAKQQQKTPIPPKKTNKRNPKQTKLNKKTPQIIKNQTTLPNPKQKYPHNCSRF